MIRPVRFVCGVGLFLGLLACGGGGASVSQNVYAGNWSGTGTWQIYDSGGNPTGSPATNIQTFGTVASNGNVDIEMHFGAGSSNIWDNMRGTVDSNGAASGQYIDAKNQDGSGGNLYSYTAAFSRVGNHLNVTFVEIYGSNGLTVHGTYSLDLQ